MGDKKSKRKDAEKAARQQARKAAEKAAREAAAGEPGVAAVPAGAGVDQRMTALVEAVWEHREELQRLAVELPVLLAATGRHMQEAGLGARRASAGLAGDVRELAGHAADMLAASKDQLRAVLRALEGTGAVLRNLPFIGSELGNTVVGGLGAIGEVADHLEVAGEKVRTLGERLATVGADLDVMGGSLLDGAAAMGAFAGVSPGVVAGAGSTRPKKAPAKRAPVQKTAATTLTAAKKPPAGKRTAGASSSTTPASTKTAATKTATTKASRAPRG